MAGLHAIVSASQSIVHPTENAFGGSWLLVIILLAGLCTINLLTAHCVFLP